METVLLFIPASTHTVRRICRMPMCCMISMDSFHFPKARTSVSVLNVGLLLLWVETFATPNLSDTMCGLQQAVKADFQQPKTE